MTLILNNNLTYNDLLFLNNFENYKKENIFTKIISENRIISNKSNVITNQIVLQHFNQNIILVIFVRKK